MVIIGIDPSSKKIALTVTVNDRAPDLRWRPLPTGVKTDIAKALYFAERWLKRVIREYDPKSNDVYVFIEKPFVSPKTVNAAIPLARVNGVLLAAAYGAGAKAVQDVDISRWKMIVVGKGNAGKPEIAEWCRTQWPAVWDKVPRNTRGTPDQDIIDSAGVNRYGAHVVKRMDKIERLKSMEEEEDSNAS